jgi:hypothetical protein
MEATALEDARRAIIRKSIWLSGLSPLKNPTE